MSVKQFIISVAVATAIFLIIIVSMFTNRNNKHGEEIHTAISSSDDSIIEHGEISSLSEFDENNVTVQSQKLSDCLSLAGETFDQLKGSQIIVVQTHGYEADIFCCEKNQEYEWVDLDNMSFDGYIGKKGSTGSKIEGDGKTPLGLYPLSFAFGTDETFSGKISYRLITENSYWVDDPNSKFYNQWVEGTKDKDWKSAEHLSRYSKQYEYAVAIEYNQNPVVYGKGSAIFLHCGNNPTVGCIAVSRQNMLNILQWIDEEKNPYILIL